MRRYTQPHTETLSVQVATGILNSSAGNKTMTISTTSASQIYAW
jgi:hypothetical protein